MLKIRILVVEDQNFARKAINTILETEANFLIVGEAENGVKALELINQMAVDIAIVDLDMPEMNGIELTERIQQNFPEIKVIILSGHEDEYSVEQAIKAGARAYLLKDSFVGKEIINTINCIQQGYFQLAPGLYEKLILNSRQESLEPIADLSSSTSIVAGDSIELNEVLKSQNQQIHDRLFEELNLEISNLKIELEEGLKIFQERVSTQIKSGFVDFERDRQQSQFNPELLEKRYLNLSQSLNFIESRYNSSLRKIKAEVVFLRYCVFFLLITFVPIVFSLFFNF